jgi:Nucleolar protein,Nop52
MLSKFFEIFLPQLVKSPCQILRWQSFGRVYSTVLNSIFWNLDRQPNSLAPGFWLSDKPLVQQELSTSLADLLLVIPTKDASFQFLKGFWHAIVREWSGLDYLR